MKQAFISYVEEDGEIACAIATHLEKAGFPTWYFERDSLPGANYLSQTGEAIEEAQVFILLVSPNSLDSRQVTSEVVRAHECGKPFIPVLRNLTHAEFQKRQPVWRQAAAASVRIPAQGVGAILPGLLAGLDNLGVMPLGWAPSLAYESPAAVVGPAVQPRARCLQDLATEVRLKTMQLLGAASPSELTWTPQGTSNHVLWHAGHAMWAQDTLCIERMAGTSELPRGWNEMFRMGSQPALWKKSWPAKEEIQTQLRTQLSTLI